MLGSYESWTDEVMRDRIVEVREMVLRAWRTLGTLLRMNSNVLATRVWVLELGEIERLGVGRWWKWKGSGSLILLMYEEMVVPSSQGVVGMRIVME